MVRDVTAAYGSSMTSTTRPRANHPILAQAARANAAGQPAGLSRSSASTPEYPMGSPSRSRILVVDDNQANRDTLHALLHGEGHEITFAEEGKSALCLADETRPDLVLLDVMMPGLDGFEVCRRLRKNHDLREVPIILITALDDRASRLEGIEAGADDFISRPYDIHELRLRVKTITRLNRFRRIADERLRFEGLFASAPNGILLADAHLHIRSANRALDRMLDEQGGVSAVGQDVTDLMAPGEDLEFAARLAGLKPDSTTPVCLESNWRRADGEVFPVEIDMARLPVGDEVLLQLHVRDLTARKLAEAQLIRAQRMENLGLVVGGMAHDLNNVLSPIIGAAQALPDTEDPEGRREFADLIVRSAKRGATIVRRSLDMVRGNGGDKSGTLAPGETIAEVIEFIRSTFPRSITVEADIAEGLPRVSGLESAGLYQILLNLCVNARDAMPEGGALAVRARAEEQSGVAEASGGKPRTSAVIIEIADTGTGIPAELHEKIFEPLFTTKPSETGTGLGLSTTRQILLKARGDIRLHSVPGKGACFTIELPCRID